MMFGGYLPHDPLSGCDAHSGDNDPLCDDVTPFQDFTMVAAQWAEKTSSTEALGFPHCLVSKLPENELRTSSLRPRLLPLQRRGYMQMTDRNRQCIRHVRWLRRLRQIQQPRHHQLHLRFFGPTVAHDR